MKPRFITFSLASVDGEQPTVERGLLLPMSGENTEKAISVAMLPLANGLKFATAPNHVYQISGIGVDFSITPSRKDNESELAFHISVNEKDSRKFESDNRFDTIREYFKASQVRSMFNHNSKSTKRPLMHYMTENLSAQSTEFDIIMTLLASLHAVIMIPREYLTVGEMKGYSHRSNTTDANNNWPYLDWQKSPILPPSRQEEQIRISAPIVKGSNVCYVDEYPSHLSLCQNTLSYQGRSFSEQNIVRKIRSLYFDWHNLCKTRTTTL